MTERNGGNGNSPIIESKYLFPALRKDAVLDWLNHVCIPDPEHPEDTVFTIYFDTPELLLYREKKAGAFYRSKPRLRWYGKHETRAKSGSVQAFFEIKERIGSQRKKRRIPVEISGSTLGSRPLQSAEVQDVTLKVLELSEHRNLPWIPVLLSSYTRHRFLDLASWSRVSVDVDICCEEINEMFFSGIAPAEINTGVLEVKGKNAEFPSSLFPISEAFESSSFSKYAGCLERCMVGIIEASV